MEKEKKGEVENSKHEKEDIEEDPLTLDYKVIGSGSSGNCVKIEDMMVDVGLPYKVIEKELYKVRYILITHVHSDHLKMSTAKRIKKMFPSIKWIGNWDVVKKIDLDYVIGDSTKIKLKDRTIRSFKCIHNVPTHGFTISYKNFEIIYATDTASLRFAPTGPYDYLFLESNHDQKKVEAIINNSKKIYGYDAYAGAKRHLPTQKSKAFYYLNRRNRDSKWIELHKSSRFY